MVTIHRNTIFYFINLLFQIVVNSMSTEIGVFLSIKNCVYILHFTITKSYDIIKKSAKLKYFTKENIFSTH